MSVVMRCSYGARIAVAIVSRNPPPFSLPLRPFWPLSGGHRDTNLATSTFHGDMYACRRVVRRRGVDGAGGGGTGLVRLRVIAKVVLLHIFCATPEPMPLAPRCALTFLPTVFGFSTSPAFCKFAWVRLPFAAHH